jgi:TonB family protein
MRNRLRWTLLALLAIDAGCHRLSATGNVVARPRATLSPKYPDLLRMASVEGIVVVDLAIDSTGRVDASHTRMIRSDHDLFAMSVRRAIDTTSWLPARSMGQTIPSVRRDTFSFVLKKDSAAACPKSTEHHKRICTYTETRERRSVS